MTSTELQHTPVGSLLVWASKIGHVPAEYRGRHDIGGRAGAVVITRSPGEVPGQVAVYVEELITADQASVATLRAEILRLRSAMEAIAAAFPGGDLAANNYERQRIAREALAAIDPTLRAT